MNPENEVYGHPIHPGTIIHSPYWPKPVEVKLKFDSLPHRIEAVYGYVPKFPRIRFL